MNLNIPARLKSWIAGAEKAAVAAASAFVVGSSAGYVATHDWRGFLWGLGGAALGGLSTYWVKNSPVDVPNVNTVESAAMPADPEVPDPGTPA